MSTPTPATTPCNLQDAQQVISCLHAHLNAICAVEFYTIPLYLTATYSFSVAAGNSTTPLSATDSTPLFWWMQQKSLSVAVQEMYHLQCASNIANAAGFHPNLDPSVFDWSGPVPHLPNVKGTGFDNLPNVLDVLIGIETPIEGGFPPPNVQVVYDSISALYHATLTLLDIVVAADGLLPLQPGPVLSGGSPQAPLVAPDQMYYLTFQSRYQYTVVKCADDIAHLANAVSFQGEGAGVVADFASKFPNLAKVLQAGDDGSNGEVPAQYQPKAGSRFARWDNVSHYERFVALKAMMTSAGYEAAAAQLPAGRSVFNRTGAADPDRPAWVADAAALQNCINLAYSRTLDIINNGMTVGGPLDTANSGSSYTFTVVMTSFKYLIPQLWQWGQVPTFSYVAGVTDDQLQAAFDQADPLCLYHWDKVTQQIREEQPDDMNVCQGLNSCQGLGWGGLGTQAGDGACATADIHTCSGGNSCRHRGGCGYTVSGSPIEDQWVPGWNSCKGLGGCQVPISTQQKFSSPAPQGSKVQPGDGVWDEARKLLQKNGVDVTRSVQAKQGWQGTGVDVTQGQPLTVSFRSGLWSADPKTNDGAPYDAKGCPGVIVPADQTGYPIVGVAMGALVGRIGGGTPFLVGDGISLSSAPAGGLLELCINDDINHLYGPGLADNFGSVSVEITTPITQPLPQPQSKQVPGGVNYDGLARREAITPTST